jgi:hypothetical protein
LIGDCVRDRDICALTADTPVVGSARVWDETEFAAATAPRREDDVYWWEADELRAAMDEPPACASHVVVDGSIGGVQFHLACGDDEMFGNR